MEAWSWIPKDDRLRPERKGLCMTENKPKGPAPASIEGEGSYTATHRYNEKLKRQIDNVDVEELAEQARKALEGKEGDDLRDAERRAKQGPPARKPAEPGRRN
jgi:hypothetical protein